MNNENRPHLKKKRKLSSYMCQELLYDYLSGQLDEDRNEDVNEYLKESDDCNTEKENIEFALEYCNNLAATEISQPLNNELIHNEFNLYKYVNYIHWKTWPSYLRWSAQGFTASLIVALIAIQFPWINDRIYKLTTTDRLILARINKPTKSLIQKNETESTSEEALEIKTLISQKSKSKENIPSPKKQASNLKDTVKKNKIINITKKVKADLNTGKAVEARQNSEEDIPSSITNSNSESSNSEFKDELLEGGDQEGDLQKATLDGQLFRVYMVLSNVDEIMPSVVNKIKELGGKKAGRVEIGLRKNEGAYFHFILSELNETMLYSYLKSFGAVKIYEKKHKRVMIDGERRYILWIQDLKR